MGIYNELSRLEGGARPARPVKLNSPQTGKNPQVDQPIDRSTGESMTQSTAPSTPRSTSRRIDRSTRAVTDPPVSSAAAAGIEPAAVEQRPKAFYLTQNQTDTLDEVVKKVGQSQRVKQQVEARRVNRPDRSTIMRLILDEIDLSDDSLIDRLVLRLVD